MCLLDLTSFGEIINEVVTDSYNIYKYYRFYFTCLHEYVCEWSVLADSFLFFIVN